MPTWDAVHHEHVLRAVAEFDRIGQAAFLDHYGFGEAKDYLLIVDDHRYDSKAIAGVAHGYATGSTLAPEDFNGGRDGAAGVLRALGFEVEGYKMEEPDVDLPEAAAEVPVKAPTGTYRVSDGAQVNVADAQSVWVPAARERLIATAKEYQALTTYKDLAEEVQADSGVRTRQLMRNWIGTVLTLVAEDCARRGEPLLSSLCITKEGTVGPGYAASVEALRGIVPADTDDHAAAERLACYRHFGATIPADGGRPALSPLVKSRRDRATKARPERRGALCPTCFVELPVSGRCMACGG